MTSFHRKQVVIIMAVEKNNGIGFQNKLPWPRIPEDMEHFKSITTRCKDDYNKINAVIMGRKTLESMGEKPLLKRVNVVVSTTYEMKKDNRNFIVLPNVKKAIDFLQYEDSIEDIFIIGGSEIFSEGIQYADRVIITRIQEHYDCDVFIKDEFFGLLGLNFKMSSKQTIKSSIPIEIEYYERNQ